MNKYRAAALKLIGRDCARLITEGSQPDVKTPEGRLEYFSTYKPLNPDSAIHRFGDSSDFTAFIYSSATNTLFCQPGNMYHSDGLGGNSELEEIEHEPQGTETFFGRYGKVYGAGGFVTIWDVSSGSRKEQYHGYTIGGADILKKMLVSMVNRSVKIVGDSPAELPDGDYVFKSYSDEFPIGFVKDIIGGQVAQDTEDAECKRLAKVNVRGKEMDLGTALGNLHMVKGPELQFMKTAICANHDQLQADLEKHSCKAQLATLGDILNKLSCPAKGDQGEWQRLKSQGRAQYRQDLRGIFADPDKMDREFRTQKDIDAAWDELQHGKRENKLSFQRWLTLKEQENYARTK